MSHLTPDELENYTARAERGNPLNGLKFRTLWATYLGQPSEAHRQHFVATAIVGYLNGQATVQELMREKLGIDTTP